MKLWYLLKKNNTRKIKLICPSNILAIRKKCKLSSHITLIIAVAADGTLLRPAFILSQLKEYPSELIDVQTYNDIAITSTKSGWEEPESFKLWIEKILLPSVRSRRAELDSKISDRVLLLSDQHYTRTSSSQLLNKLIDERIDLFVFPSNTTHITQPCDRGVFLYCSRQRCGKILLIGMNMQLKVIREEKLY